VVAVAVRMAVFVTMRMCVIVVVHADDYRLVGSGRR
jgi:hypothetical protein